MRFREWLRLQEAVLSKQGIEFSTPENIELLASLPKRQWVGALAQKYTTDLIDFVNGDIVPSPDMKQVVDQLKAAGINITDISRETRIGGDQIKLPSSNIAARRAIERLLRKWLAVSQGIPTNTLDKNGSPKDPQQRAEFQKFMAKATAKDLHPNINIIWNPNQTQPSMNKYDDPRAEDEAMWVLARNHGLNSPQEMDQWIKQHCVKRIQGYASRGKLPAQFADQMAEELYQYAKNNLMRTDPNHPNHRSLRQIIDSKIAVLLNRKSSTNRYSMQHRSDAYNNKQLTTNFANSTPDAHRMTTDPMTLRNRSITPIPMPQPKISQAKMPRKKAV